MQTHKSLATSVPLCTRMPRAVIDATRASWFSAPLVAPKRRGGEMLTSAAVAAPTGSNGSSQLLQSDSEQAYLGSRTQFVSESFPNSLSVDDYVHRVETALYPLGFSGENSIACTNVCRDEITAPLRDKIDLVFGSSFNINGLGGVLTCGVIGIGAGLSHSPVDSADGKERYVFFSFPHIAVSPHHDVGGMNRFNRPGGSKACGALVAALGQFQSEGLTNGGKPGVHDPKNPEYTILKQRLAQRLEADGKTAADLKKFDLVDLTKVAERAISADLEALISEAVDPKKADYAVFTGVQIHSWGEEYDDSTPNLEYVAPATAYAVVDGQKYPINLADYPGLTPRQSREVAAIRGIFVGSGRI